MARSEPERARAASPRLRHCSAGAVAPSTRRCRWSRSSRCSRSPTYWCGRGRSPGQEVRRCSPAPRSGRSGSPRGSPRARCVLGLLGVTVAALVALSTGRAVDFFLVQIVSNAASALVWAVSIVVRWPLLGIVVGTLLGQRTRWRRDPDLMRGYQRASWVWVAQYLVRLAVFLPLYAADADSRARRRACRCSRGRSSDCASSSRGRSCAPPFLRSTAGYATRGTRRTVPPPRRERGHDLVIVWNESGRVHRRNRWKPHALGCDRRQEPCRSTRRTSPRPSRLSGPRPTGAPSGSPSRRPGRSHAAPRRPGRPAGPRPHHQQGDRRRGRGGDVGHSRLVLRCGGHSHRRGVRLGGQHRRDRRLPALAGPHPGPPRGARQGHARVDGPTSREAAGAPPHAAGRPGGRRRSGCGSSPTFSPSPGAGAVPGSGSPAPPCSCSRSGCSSSRAWNGRRGPPSPRARPARPSGAC